MPRIRSLKPEFFRSPSTAKADFPVRIFYQALWCWADDFGIGETNIHGLLGFAFPDDDGFSAQDVRRFCADCARHFGVVFYTHRERAYYAIPSWPEHQKLERRDKRRRNPLPDDPGSSPDQRFMPCADSAPDSPRKSGAESCEMDAGTGEHRNIGTGEQNPPTPHDDEPPPNRLPAKQTGAEKARTRFANTPARSIDAHRIAQAFSDSLPTPIESGLLADIAVQVDRCLHDGIPPPATAIGLRDWTNSGAWSAKAIPNFVHKANNRHARAGPGKATRKALDYDTAAAELLAELQPNEASP